MCSMAGPQPTDSGCGRVLLIGDISKALLDVGRADQHTFEVCANILDGIDAAVRHRFDAVGLVMDGTSSQLGSALRALRKSTRARIILLAQMYEEPIARRLVAEVPGEERLADEYLVCPVSMEKVRRLEGQKIGGEPEQALELSDLFRFPSSSPEALEQRLRHLERLATTDDLTGLKNRRYLWEFARQILDRARRTDGRVTLLVFDIDSFKHYNDTYGHAAGDEILREVGVLMRRCCRSHDVVGRIGGDEFAAVFWDDPHSPSADTPGERRAAAEHPTEAISVAKRFQRALGNADLNLLGPRGEGVLTISGGLASFPRDGSTVEQLFERADQALLEAKRSGKNRIHLVGDPRSDIADIE